MLKELNIFMCLNLEKYKEFVKVQVKTILKKIRFVILVF